MNHVADDVTYCHDLHYAAATLGLVDGGHEKKKKKEREKGQTPSRNVTLAVGCVRAGKCGSRDTRGMWSRIWRVASHC